MVVRPRRWGQWIGSVRAGAKRSKPARVALFLGALAALLALRFAPANAQQGSFPEPQLQMPQSPSQTAPPINGRQGSGQTLELSPLPGGQGGNAMVLPRNSAAQPGQAVELPPVARQTTSELSVPSTLLRQPGYAQVTVTVTNQGGRYVTDLSKGDFRVLVNGEPAEVKFLRQDENTPVSVGIIVDTSGSMQPKLAQARAAVTDFLRRLNPKDDVFLFAFSDRPYLLQAFTTNHYLVMSKLALLHAYGQTALYDAILDGLLMVSHGRWDKKALLVLTDGMDNVSQSSLAQVVYEARRMKVLIYSIGIGNPNSGGGGFAFGPFIFGGDMDRVDAKTLRTLSVQTGARTFVLGEVGDGALLRRDMTDISQELREQYTLGFEAPDPKRTGYRRLSVEIPTHPDYSVRVRKGVEVGAGSPSAYAEERRSGTGTP